MYLSFNPSGDSGVEFSSLPHEIRSSLSEAVVVGAIVVRNIDVPGGLEYVGVVKRTHVRHQ